MGGLARVPHLWNRDRVGKLNAPETSFFAAFGDVFLREFRWNQRELQETREIFLANGDPWDGSCVNGLGFGEPWRLE